MTQRFSLKYWFFVGYVALSLLSHEAYALSLKDGLKIALENDKDIQAKNNALEIILDEIRSAEGLNYPTVDFTTNVQREKLTGSRISANDYNRKAYDWEFILRQPLYDGRDAHYEEKLQHERYESAKYFMLDGANALALQYIEAYLNVLREKALLEFSQESLSINEKIFAKNKLKFEKGFATRLEFERSQAKLNESIANHASQTMNYEESLITLRHFIQFDIDASTLKTPHLDFPIPNSLSQARQEAFAIHPSIKTSDINIQVALNEYKREQKRFHPKLDLVARYGSGDEIPGLEQPTHEYRVGLELRYNLYNGGKDSAASNKAQKYIEEKRILAERARQQIENRLRLAWNAYTLNNQKLPQMRSYTNAKKAVLETTMIEYDFGTADLNVLLTTEDEYIIAKKALIATERDLQLARFRIREAMGDIVERIILSQDSNTSPSGLADEVEKGLHLKPTAYVEAELLKWDVVPHKEATQKHTAQCFTCKSKILNVRKEPHLKSAIVNHLSEGESVCGDEWQGSWLKTTQGWVNSDYLDATSKGNPSEPSVPTVPQTQAPTAPTHSGSKPPDEECYLVTQTINVRCSPTIQSSITGHYAQNQTLCANQSQGAWLKVPKGWISNAYLQRINSKVENQ